MNNSNTKKRNKRDFKFSDKDITFLELGTAELEKSDIEAFYLPNEYFNDAKNLESRKTFFIARTGLGKSAIIEKVRSSTDKKFIVQIDPESFMPSLLRNATTLANLETCGVNIDYFLKTLWRFVFAVELLKRRHGGDKKGVLEIFKKSNGIQKRVYHFLEKYKTLGPEYSISERILGFVKELTDKINISLEVKGVKLEVAKTTLADEVKSNIQEALKEFEFTEVNQLIKDLDEYLSGESYYLLIDDLDKAWVESGIGVSLIKSLFLTMMDIANLRNVKPVVSLRLNLFAQIKFAQPEKIRPFISKILWSDNDLKNMIDLRFKFLYKIDTNYIWQNIFPSEIHLSSGETLKIHKYLMQMSNRKPRDLFYFIATAMKQVKNKNRITQEAFRKAEIEFSEDRLLNFIAEWESPYSGLKDLLNYFKGHKSRMSGKELRAIIDSMILHISDSLKKEEKNYLWARHTNIIGERVDNFDDPQGIWKFLYEIGVIGYKNDQHKIKFSYDFDSASLNDSLKDEFNILLNPALALALTSFSGGYLDDQQKS